MNRTLHPYDFSVMEEGYEFIFKTKGDKHISVFFSKFEWEEVQSPVFQISIDNREGTSETPISFIGTEIPPATKK